MKHAESVLAVLLLVCFIGIDLFTDGPFEAARDWLFSAYQRTWPAERDGSHTAVVEIDEESMRRFGQWPWRRDNLARLISAAHEARAIGVDILLPEADRLAPANLLAALPLEASGLRQALLALPDPDATLASALRDLPVVLAATVDNSQPPSSTDLVPTVRRQGNGAAPPVPSASGFHLPLPMLARAARGIGVISALRSERGTIDELPAVVEVSGLILPGFAIELLAVAQGARDIVLNTMPSGVVSVSICSLTISASRTGSIRPRFIDPSRLIKIPAYRIMEPAADLSTLRDRIAIIGVTAGGIGETFQTPVGVSQSGPEIQAQVIESILSGDTLYRPFWAGSAEAAAALALGLTAAALLGRIRYRAYVTMLGSVMLLLAGGSIVLFRRQGLLLDSILPIICLTSASIVALSARLRAETAARRRLNAQIAVAVVQREAERRELELHSEAERLRHSLGFAVDAARLGVWDADLRNGTWVHSAQHDLILGLSDPPTSWSPDILLDRVVPEDLPLARARMILAQESGILEVECRIGWDGGDPRHIHVVGRCWRDTDGAIGRTAGVVADITQQRLLEARLRQSEKLQAIGLLAAGVAHNFNNLLTIVIGNLELARRKVANASDATALLCSATTASLKCAEISRHLLAFGRLQTLLPVRADPVDMLQKVCEMLRDALPDWVLVSLETPPELPKIKIDAAEFELALLNLAMNAKDAMPDGGAITITAFPEDASNSLPACKDRFLVIEVIDNGTGIPSDKLPKVFEPFFTTKEIGRGTGLGLSQVHGFAYQSGGRVEIESNLGQGTRVRLYLPINPV